MINRSFDIVTPLKLDAMDPVTSEEKIHPVSASCLSCLWASVTSSEFYTFTEKRVNVVIKIVVIDTDVVCPAQTAYRC